MPADDEARADSRAATAARWAEAWLPEDAPLEAARARADEVGIVPVTPGEGQALRLLAAAAGARGVVELGTGTGVSGTWLLRGMRPDGVLTTVDSEGEHQRLARQTFAEAGYVGGRARLIAGRASEVLPRLSDGAYDLVLCHTTPAEYADYLPDVLRLLRPGGLLVAAGALSRGRVPDSSARDPETVALREYGRAVREDARLVPALLPVGDGLIVAARAG